MSGDDEFVKLTEEEFPWLGSKAGSGRVRFIRPEGEVEDVLMRVAIVADGVPICRYGADSQSVEIISCSVRSVNGKKMESRAFTNYVTIVTGNNSNHEDSDFQIIFQEVVRSTTVMGTAGWYVMKNNKWYHLRMVIEEILADYQCLCSIMGHGAPMSDWMCLKCEAHKGYYCLLVNAILEKRWDKVLFNSEVKTPPSSFQYLHPHSLCRSASAVIHAKMAGTSIVKAMRFKSYVEKELVKREELGILEDLKFVDESYLFQWVPVVLPPQTMDRYYLKKLSEIQGCTEEEIVMMYKKYPKVEQPPKGKEEFYSKNTLLPRRGVTGLDGMHKESADVQKCSDTISNSLESDKEFARDLAGAFNMFIATKKYLCRIPGEVPKVVMVLAYKRLEELSDSRYPWITPGLVYGENVRKLTCEQRIVFYFNLFPYIFQDSLQIPIVHYMKKFFCLSARIYSLRRGKSKIRILQSRISYYLGQLQGNTLPTFMPTLPHTSNHMPDEVRYHGSIQDRTCFFT